jgi:hypothetical protein
VATAPSPLARKEQDMKADDILSFFVVILVGIIFTAAWNIGVSRLERDCIKLGVFYIGDRVYECKLKEKT